MEFPSESDTGATSGWMTATSGGAGFSRVRCSRTLRPSRPSYAANRCSSAAVA